MTPKEIAYAAFVGDEEYETLIKNIEQAIKDAVEEAHNIDVASGLKQIDFYVAAEREACAKKVEWFLAQTDLSMDELPVAIRGRGWK